MTALASLIVVSGILPARFVETVGLPPVNRPDVSILGVGLVYVLPWLAGMWLARIRSRLGNYLDLVQRAASLEWFGRIASWVGQRLAGAIYWLGLVGEGEGWWGWALVILALGTIFLTIR
jgi:hypothetical protein